MRVCLSGAISDDDPDVQIANLAALDAAALDIHALHPKAEIVNPAELAREHPDLTWEEYMLHCLAELLDSDCHALLPSWNDSRGAVIEVLVSQVAGIPHVHPPNLEPYPTIQPGHLAGRIMSLVAPAHLETLVETRVAAALRALKAKEAAV